MTNSTRIYHNPKCSKSRQALQYLKDQGIEPEVIEYMNNPLNADELGELLMMLSLEPSDVLRKSEAEYKELDLANTSHSRQSLIQAIVKHPQLMQRPIIVHKNRAVIARPTENIAEIL